MKTSKERQTCCCGDAHCNSGRRNRYFPRKQLTADTYQVEQSYQQQRRHLINRAVHGWGVVYGFRLTLENTRESAKTAERHLNVGDGFALDACGRELVWLGTNCAEAQRVDLADIIALDGKGALLYSPEDHRCKGNVTPPWQPGTWLLSVHYAERLIGPVAVNDPCQCDGQEWDQLCETVCFSLRPQDPALCCQEQRCDLDCECCQSKCCSAGDVKPSQRGGCRCLCDHLTNLPIPDCCGLSSLSKTLKVDLCHGVPLACVTLTEDECHEWTIAEVHDDCGPRRLVKRNDLLFDLIRGCDLTHISKISWGSWHRNLGANVDLTKLVRFEDFAQYFKFADQSESRIPTTFVVTFSRDVDCRTIAPDCFSMTLIARDDEEGWGRTLRVPIVYIDTEPGTHTGYALSARIWVDAKWARDALLEGISVFTSGITRLEIEVHGDYLMDCNGQMVDANARGLLPAPTGNGTPGGTFYSTFWISKKEPDDAGTPNIL